MYLCYFHAPKIASQSEPYNLLVSVSLTLPATILVLEAGKLNGLQS